MTEAEAVETLKRHSMTLEVLDATSREKSFVWSLRPFDRLRMEHFGEIMESMMTLSHRIAVADKEILSMIWNILNEGYAMALSSTRRYNTLPSIGRISSQEMESVHYWLFCIGYAVTALLNNAPKDEAFDPFTNPSKLYNSAPRPIPGISAAD